ncbi:MAG: UDP-3-O-(3-hydroxymyristoyl)glucosamine N-acyltransferase [Desulfobacterales bacterium]|nr:UDP-3-O-(3-hydroxymyristoyl)glucosamine N-acyltransferase [Desulfobacterales bacterium]
MEISLGKIAELVDGKITGDSDKDITGVAPFFEAIESDITYADNKKLLKRISETNAGAIIVPRDFTCDSANLVQTGDPRIAFAKLVDAFFPDMPLRKGISSKACIGKKFIHGDNISIYPGVVVGDNVTVGNNVVIHAGTVIENGVTIGDDIKLYPNVTILERCTLGNRVIIHSGTVIGCDGFGFAPEGEKYYKIPQKGIVRIDDDVEIGASNTIDRATFGKTWIKSGVKTDNLVHIAHNVTIGENTLLVAQVGIAGSTTVGRHVIMAGQAGVTGHIKIGDNVIIGPKAGIGGSIEDNQIVSGAPEMPHRLWLKVSKILPRLPELRKKLKEIEARLCKVEEDK